jgi:hypothetical protein
MIGPTDVKTYLTPKPAAGVTPIHPRPFRGFLYLLTLTTPYNNTCVTPSFVTHQWSRIQSLEMAVSLWPACCAVVTVAYIQYKSSSCPGGIRKMMPSLVHAWQAIPDTAAG